MDPAQKEIVKKLALQFINQQTVGIIATVSADATPEAATVMYIMDEDWSLYILTHADSRKALNIQANPHVAFVIGTTLVAHTVQIQGEATILTVSDPQYQIISQKFRDSRKLTLNPLINTYVTNYILLKITPTWVRYLSFDQATNKEQYAVLIP